MSDNNLMSFQRCAVLKVKNISNHIIQWYEDLQIDYKKFFPVIHSWCCDHGYKIFNDLKEPIFIEPNQQLQNLSETSKDKLQILLDYGNMICRPKSQNSSAYGIFYEKYKPATKAKYSYGKKNLFKSVNSQNFMDQVNKQKLNEFISEDDWRQHQQNMMGLDDKQIEKYYKENLAEKLTNTFRHVGKTAREQYLIPSGFSCKHSNDKAYCVSLANMVGRQLRSQIEKSKDHAKELKNLTEIVSEFNHPLLSLIKEYDDELIDIDSGLSNYVFKNACMQVTKPKKDSKILIQVQILSKPKYKSIIDNFQKSIKEVMIAFGQHKKTKELNNRLLNGKYILLPNLTKDYKIYFDDFKLSVSSNGNLIANIKNLGEIVCLHSNYVCNLKLECVENGYKITFNHKLKRKTQEVGPLISGIVKELGLQKKNNEFFLTLPFTIQHSSINFDIGKFFLRATPKNEELLKVPDEFKVCAFDLNLSMPLAVTSAVVGRHIDGEINVDSYGQAKIIESIHLVHDNDSYIFLKEFKKDCYKAKDVIKEIKKNIKKLAKDKNLLTNSELFLNLNDRILSEELTIFLQQVKWKPKYEPITIKQQLSVYRMKIQILISNLTKRINEFNYESRKTGHDNISELIWLIDAEDTYKSLMSSYKRIHLQTNEFLRDVKFDSKRANKKQYLLRRIAAKLANYCYKNKINLLIGENLNMEQNADNGNKENSLTRLFSPKTTADTIRLALEKYGIAFIDSAAPDGTSKTDPLTGNLAYRDENNKRKLYVLREGKWEWIDSDLSASINILIRGLNRSIVPYKLHTKEKKQISKRNEQFFMQYFNTKKPFFYEDVSGFAVACVDKRKNSVGILDNNLLYYRNGKFITEANHYKMANLLKDSLKDSIDFFIAKETKLFKQGQKLLNFHAPVFTKELLSEI